MLKSDKAVLTEGEKALVRVRTPMLAMGVSNGDSTLLFTNRKIYYKALKEGFALGYRCGSIAYEEVNSINFGASRNDFLQVGGYYNYRGHPLFINEERLGLVSFYTGFIDDLKKDIADAFDEKNGKYTNNMTLNYVLGLLDALADGGYFKQHIKICDWG